MSNTESVDALTDENGALLAAVLDQTHDCIKLLDRDGVIQYVNGQGARLMELSSPSDLLGKSYIERWPKDVRSKVSDALDAAGQGQLGRFTASRLTNGAVSWWDVTVSPVQAPNREIIHFVTIARDMTTEVRERDRVEAISLEMRHRLKNSLAVASGIIMLSARGTPELESFARQIASRLAQLSDVQALVLDPATEQMLDEYVPMLAGAYGNNALLKFGSLPHVKLGDRAMQALALCFGELATNSLKYGAMRNGNQVRVDGVSHSNNVTLTWLEETAFQDPRSGGRGLRLIERLVETAGGSFKREVGGEMMRATMTLPLEH